MTRRPKVSPYISQPVTLQLGPEERKYYVQRELLQNPPWIASTEPWWGHLSLPDIDESTGHVLVHYLYTGTYQTLDNIETSPADEAHIEFKRAFLAYIAATSHELDGLRELAVQKIEQYGLDLDLVDIVDAIDEDFLKLPENTPWFQDYLALKVKNAFEKDHTAFLETNMFNHISNVTLSKTLAQCMMVLYNDKISCLLRTKETMEGNPGEDGPGADGADPSKDEEESKHHDSWGVHDQKTKGVKVDFSLDAFDPTPAETIPTTFSTLEQEPREDDAWGFCSKKKGKKDAVAIVEEPEPAPAPEHEEPKEEEDPWSSLSYSFGGTNDKKKKKKKKGAALIEEATEPEPAPEPAPETETPKEDDAWGWGSVSMGKKKKGKKGVIEEIKEEPVIEEPPPPVPEPAPPTDDDWGSFAVAGSKEKKKSKKGAKEELLVEEPPPPPALELEPELEPLDEVEVPFDPFVGLSKAQRKKKEKQLKAKVEEAERKRIEEEEAAAAVAEPANQHDVPIPGPDDVEEPETKCDDEWGMPTSGKKNHSKRDAHRNEVPAVDVPVVEMNEQVRVVGIQGHDGQSDYMTEPQIETCPVRAKHLLEGNMWKDCKSCRAVLRQVAIQLARTSNVGEDGEGMVDQMLLS